MRDMSLNSEGLIRDVGSTLIVVVGAEWDGV